MLLLVLLCCRPTVAFALTAPRCVLLGGSGQIGTAVGRHLLRKRPNAHVILVGRSITRGQAALKELQLECPSSSIEFCQANVWNNDAASTLLDELLASADVVIHTAGPYMDRQPTILRRYLQRSDRPRVYVDVSDPLPFLEQSLLLNQTACSANVTALVAAGAFPGMSNVLAVEAAEQLLQEPLSSQLEVPAVENLYFQYFTAGLGGSGALNLYITNLGFGEPMVEYDKGELRWFPTLSGRLLGQVDFGELDATVHNRVGRQQVFAWPFPEAATVAKELKVRGRSTACMGTAPAMWNTMLGVLVGLVPRPLWRNQRFSQFLADFSEPLVRATDAYLRWRDSQGIGETHAMRIDVGRRDGSGIVVVQAHDSFRECVGQSCAEFALDCLDHPSLGVYLPEQRYRDLEARRRIIGKLTTIPGTFCYTGPVSVDRIAGPTELNRALQEAVMSEYPVAPW